MPIRPFLAGQAFDPETIRDMSLAFEKVCEALSLKMVDDAATRLVALPWPRRTVGELVADGLSCTAGDRAIGHNLDQPIVPSLNTMLERLSAETAMEFVVEPSG
jgi:hypothetical protein